MGLRLKHLLRSQELARAGVLFAPASFLTATPEQLLDVCNGCGAAGSWFRPPAKIYGTFIGYACHIHDWMYHFGRTDEDKQEADRAMLNNLNRLIERDSGKWYKPTMLQRRRAKEYYHGVKYFGGPAFWKGKN